MFNQSDLILNNSFVNNIRPATRNARVSNGATINNYLITIPRCDLPKKYVFDGLFKLCNRLAISKEKHTITYIGYCCKNSSVNRKANRNGQAQHNPNLPRQSSQNLNDTITSITSQPITNESLQRILSGELLTTHNLQRYKRPRLVTNDNTNENISYSPVESVAESSFLSDTHFDNEINDNWLHCNSHIHVFAEFSEELVVDFQKCKRIMKWCVEDYNVHVEPCKSPRNAIKYVTKEDPNPLLKNVNAEECSFHKKMMDWIKANPEYDLFDPFICSRPNFYKLITMAHSDYYKKNPIHYEPCRGLNRVTLDCNNNETKISVQEWFNECVSSWRVKFPALYLWGESNTGKTSIIFDWLLARHVNENQIYRPARNCQFAWGYFNPREHLVVVMDEFEFTQFDFEEWKNIVEGRTTSVRVKGRPPKTIAIKCPIIMISNYQPPMHRNEIINRIRIVKSERLDNENMF